MATTLGTAYIRIAPELNGVQKSISSALSGGASSASSGIGGVLSSTVGQVAIGTALGGALLGGVKAVAGKIFDVVKDISSSATKQMDSIIRTKTALQQMGYEETKVAEKLAFLRTNATKTAADVEDLADGFMTLTASWKDIDLTAKATRALSDGILSMGGTAEMVANAITQIGQVDLDGPLDGETWRSLRNSGLIPVLGTIADMNGMTLGEYKKALGSGDLSTRNFIEALISLDEAGKDGQASLESIAKQNAAKTFSGSLESAKQSIVSSLAEIKEEAWTTSGAGNFILDMGDKISVGLKKMVEYLKTAGEQIGKYLEESGIMEFLKSLWDILKNVGEIFIKNILPPLAAHIALIVGAGKILIDIFAWLARAVTPILKWIGGILENVNSFIDFVYGKIIEFAPKALDFIKRFFDGFGKGIQIGLKKFENFAAGIVDNIKNFFGGVAKGAEDTVNGIGSSIKDFFVGAFGPIIDWFSKFFKGVGKGLAEIGEKLKPVFQPFVDAINIIIQAASNGIRLIVVILKKLIQGFARGLSDGFNMVVNSIQSFVNGVVDWIKSVFSVVSEFFMQVGNAIYEGFVAFISPILEFLTPIFEGVVAVVNDVVESIKKTFTDLWNAITGTFANIGKWFGDRFEEAMNLIKSAFNPIVDWFKNLWDKITYYFQHPEQLGHDFVAGLWNGINDKVGWILDRIKGFGEDVLNGLKNILGIHSPSKYTAEMGRFLDMGLANGIIKNTGVVDKAMEGMAKEALERADIVSQRMNSALSSQFGANIGTESNAISRNINQYNTFNQVANDIDIKEMSRSLGFAVETAI